MTKKQIRRSATRLAYSIVRLAKYTDCSRSTIYEEIAAGRLIARKLGRRTIVTRSDALKWLRSLPTLAPGTPAAQIAADTASEDSPGDQVEPDAAH
jgi:excisionase family DNA binding protein